jgi:hypothetical protein
MAQSSKESLPKPSFEELHETPFDRVPPKIPSREAGFILKYAREELQVTRQKIHDAFGISHEMLDSFESGQLPLNKCLWIGYVLGVKQHHDLTRSRANGLFRGLVNEIIQYEDHKTTV